MRFRKAIRPLALASLILVAGAAHAAEFVVNMVNLTFVPSSLTITAGDTVRWVNTSAFTHTTTSGTPGVPTGVWDSGLMGPALEFSFTFTTDGVYDYYCQPHGAFGMVGTITVEPTSTGIGDPPSPRRYVLHQNYPNPFNPSTTVEYTVEQRAHVVIQIFNAPGRILMTLEDVVRDPGTYGVTWDGRDGDGTRQASGIYFYQMKIDGVAVEMKKMVLLK